MGSIFLSHSSNDENLVTRFTKLLGALLGTSVKVGQSSDDKSIDSGTAWQDWIHGQILTCDIAVVVLTPSSFRSKWVLWEAGAVMGVQMLAESSDQISDEKFAPNRVRVISFNLSGEDSGPFNSLQTKNGLAPNELEKFLRDIIRDMHMGGHIDYDILQEANSKLADECRSFIEDGKEALRRTPILASEGLIQNWLDRLNEKMAKKDYDWVIGARRYINIALLGAGNADKEEAIDFRIHLTIAEALKHRSRWSEVVTQLSLALQLSPNDLAALRTLGQAYLKLNDEPKLNKLYEEMASLDPNIFEEDREAIGLRVGHWTKNEQYSNAADKLSRLHANNSSLVENDDYLHNWFCLSLMFSGNIGGAKDQFLRLRQHQEKRQKNSGQKAGFWDQGTLVNILLAVGEDDEILESLAKLKAFKRSQEEMNSAAKFYRDIATRFERSDEVLSAIKRETTVE